MSERERFEAWAKLEGLGMQLDGEHYRLNETHCSWLAWQAGADAEREACAKICDELEEYFSAEKDAALLNGDIELSNAASGEPRACRAIAKSIRARGDK